MIYVIHDICDIYDYSVYYMAPKRLYQVLHLYYSNTTVPEIKSELYCLN